MAQIQIDLPNKIAQTGMRCCRSPTVWRRWATALSMEKINAGLKAALASVDAAA